MNLTDLTRREIDLSNKRHALIKSHDDALCAINKELKEIAEEISLDSGGFDLEKIKLAESIIRVSGDASKVVHGSYKDQRRDNQRTRVIKESINDLAVNESAKLRSKYFGVKNYSGFGDQGCDCSYGMGPTHGNIVFRVELNQPIRDRDPFVLTPEEIEASIYYLQNIKDIQEKVKAA